MNANFLDALQDLEIQQKAELKTAKKGFFARLFSGEKLEPKAVLAEATELGLSASDLKAAQAKHERRKAGHAQIAAGKIAKEELIKLEVAAAQRMEDFNATVAKMKAELLSQAESDSERRLELQNLERIGESAYSALRLDLSEDAIAALEPLQRQMDAAMRERYDSAERRARFKETPQQHAQWKSGIERAEADCKRLSELMASVEAADVLR